MSLSVQTSYLGFFSFANSFFRDFSFPHPFQLWSVSYWNVQIRISPNGNLITAPCSSLRCCWFLFSQIVFFCLTEPNEEWGGVTPLVRNSEVFAQLDPEVVKKLEERQIRYTRYLPDEKNKPYASWQQSFMTKDPKV